MDEDQKISGATPEVGMEDAGKTAPSAGSGESLRPKPAEHIPYQRKHPVHKTQPAIDDLADDGVSNESYAHDSNITIRGGALSGREYRRSRSGMPRAQSSMRYGQYLEVPKGRRAIFSSVQKKRRRNALITFIVIVIVLALVAILVVRMLGGQAG